MRSIQDNNPNVFNGNTPLSTCLLITNDHSSTAAGTVNSIRYNTPLICWLAA